jgi:hypothetical protein
MTLNQRVEGSSPSGPTVSHASESLDSGAWSLGTSPIEIRNAQLARPGNSIPERPTS